MTSDNEKAEKLKKQIEEIEQALGHPTGIGTIKRGECPRGKTATLDCFFCLCGHLLDCHWPKTCEEAK
jgi:hypothetical protein